MNQPPATTTHPSGREFFLSQFLVARHLQEFKLPWRLLLDQDPVQVAAQMKAESLLEVKGDLWTCTPTGRERAEAFLHRQEEALRQAQSHFAEALAERDYPRAAQAYIQFESHQPFPNDKALNPTQESVQSLIEDLNALATSRPALLGGLPSEEVLQESARAWLWGSPPTLSCEAATLMSYVSNQRDLQRYREEGIERVQILASDASDCCQQCLQLHEQFFDIQRVPELPIVDCLNSPPCSCLYFPDL